MIYKILGSCLLLSIFLVGCKSRNDKYLARLEQVIPSGIKLNDMKSIIIIPNEGCVGCISNATSYMIENQDSLSNSLVIFTSIRDQKLFRLRIGGDFLSKKNVLQDQQNILSHPEVASVYPQIFYLVDGKVKEVNIYTASETPIVYKK